MDFQNFKKFNEGRILMKTIFKISIIHKPSLGSLDLSQKNLGPIGSAVLTFIGYKQTDRQTNRQAKFIYRLIYKWLRREKSPFPFLFIYRLIYKSLRREKSPFPFLFFHTYRECSRKNERGYRLKAIKKRF